MKLIGVIIVLGLVLFMTYYLMQDTMLSHEGGTEGYKIEMMEKATNTADNIRKAQNKMGERIKNLD